ncbi:hypothetical protein BW152_00485 [Lactococcus lactis]|uniref:WxL domain-containing protein n=1 Tax=Lactococcus lactis TaxID=1358 RepID=UPI000BFA586C|nr:WxL domain-containing protein [Lactococcus lactis]PFG85578.1 hypothetical protein BW152_00485 [Lactococcus lactis]
MLKKTTALFIGACLGLCLLGSSPAFSDVTTSTVTGEIISGDLSIAPPNDLSFSAKLNGQKQNLDLKPIQTKVTDYRGRDEGWQLTVKTSNFDEYSQNYQLLINGQLVSKSENIVYKNDKQELLKEISLPVKVEISAKAQAGSYGANLEWNLQPNIKNSIKE